MPSPSTPAVNLVLCWHMHQPWYRESLDGDYHLPWVYLHALKDYTDMAAHFEGHPEMRAVVNFTPVLLEQLADYDQQFRDWREIGTPFHEPLLNLLAGVCQVPSDVAQRRELVGACLRANATRMIDVYPAYARLRSLVERPDEPFPAADILGYLDDQYFLDLLTWYHLAWLGHSLRNHPTVVQLRAKGRDFDTKDRRSLLSLMADVFAKLIGRYRRLGERGQIELSMTPYAHPIVPLLIDFEAMRCAQEEAPGPAYPAYPGGLERARWHMRHGMEIFEKHFGMRPRGVWLSEGAISSEAVAVLDEFDVAWTASGEGVWANSCFMSGQENHCEDDRRSLFRCHTLPRREAMIFFRDDGLSDLIGFEYQDWIAEDAADDFVRNVGNVGNFLGKDADDHVVSVILDGENAWEYYPDNGYHFIGGLYERLAAADDIHLITFGEACNTCAPHSLPKLCPGSWVFGSLSTWIGDRDKNRGWDRLVEAKMAYDQVVAADELAPAALARATEQLAVCEGSDWFWWFGDYNPSDSVRDFDALYRLQLKNLYTMLQRPIPANLDQPLSAGGGQADNAGTMRRGNDG